MRCRSSWVAMSKLNSRGEARLKAFDVDVAIVEFITQSKVMRWSYLNHYLTLI